MVEGRCACQCSGGMQTLTLLPSSPTDAQACLLPEHPGSYHAVEGHVLCSLVDVLDKLGFAASEGMYTMEWRLLLSHSVLESRACSLQMRCSLV